MSASYINCAEFWFLILHVYWFWFRSWFVPDFLLNVPRVGLRGGVALHVFPWFGEKNVAFG